MIRAGGADDFPEIRAATAWLEREAQSDRYESALRQYADPGSGMTRLQAVCLHFMMAAKWRGTFLQVARLLITGTDRPGTAQTKWLEDHNARLDP
jgi:hypothetical protein